MIIWIYWLSKKLFCSNLLVSQNFNSKLLFEKLYILYIFISFLLCRVNALDVPEKFDGTVDMDFFDAF